MPIFTFRCKKGHVRELITRWDTQETECPKCGKPTYRIEAPEVPAKRNPAHGIQKNGMGL